MEEMIIVKGDSSDVYEFVSKEVPDLDSTWEASWAISSKAGQTAIMSGTLSKNPIIYEADGITVKTPANSFFVFQLTPTETESLAVGKYVIGVEIRQMDGLTPIFRREVLQNKLIIQEQIVL